MFVKCQQYWKCGVLEGTGKIRKMFWGHGILNTIEVRTSGAHNPCQWCRKLLRCTTPLFQEYLDLPLDDQVG